MATITTYKGKRGTTYRAAVFVDGRRVTATFDTRSEAHRWAEDTEDLLRSGQPLPGEIAKGDVILNEAIERYTMAVAGRKKPNTRRLDQEIGARLIRFFGERTMLDIKQEDIATYRDTRLKSVGPSTVIQDLSFIKCLYRMARVEWGIKAEDPTTDVRRPSAPKNRMSLLTPTEIDRLLDWCCVSKQEKLYSYVILQLHTAMRPAEGAALKWEQVLFDYGVIDLTETKTDPRRVPMTSYVKTMLTRMERVGEYVFLPSGKESLASRYFRRSFATACRQAGIKNFSLYGLRHSAASYLIMNGVDIRTVAEIMGHRNISQTMRYTHFFDDYKLKAIEALGKIGR